MNDDKIKALFTDFNPDASKGNVYVSTNNDQDYDNADDDDDDIFNPDNDEDKECSQCLVIMAMVEKKLMNNSDLVVDQVYQGQVSGCLEACMGVVVIGWLHSG